MEVVALKKHRHGTNVKKAGDKYFIKDKPTLNLYKALGLVNILDEELKPINNIHIPKPNFPQSTTMIVAKNSTKQKGKKGKYQRKDMVAETVDDNLTLDDNSVEEPVVTNEFDSEVEGGE